MLASTQRGVRAGAATVVVASTCGASACSSAMRASPMSRRRSLGSRSRQRAIRRRSDGGTAGPSDCTSIGRVSTAAIVSEIVSPSKSSLPVSISWRTAPKAQMSARLSTGRPRACSGLMYAAVPRIIPIAVPALVIVGTIVGVEFGLRGDLAGDRLGQPEVEDLHVAGGRQLHVRRLEIAMDDPPFMRVLEAFRNLLRDRDRFVPGAARRGSIRSRSVSPGTSSMARKRMPLASWSPKICAMFGWLSCASTWASRSNLASRSGSFAKTAGEGP
jgi:hypothetical protein